LWDGHSSLLVHDTHSAPMRGLRPETWRA